MSEGNNAEIVVVVWMQRSNDCLSIIHNDLGESASIKFSDVDPIALDDSIDVIRWWRVP